MEIKIFPDLQELSRAAAEMFLKIGGEAIEKRGQFTVALAGGSTPKSLYNLLTTDKFRSQIDWKNVFFFFGDERNVPPDDKDSNFRMANETLFEPLNIEEDKFYRWNVEINNPEKVAENYVGIIESFFHGFPAFDLILLGMGADGHTASLFPHSAALQETNKIAIANRVEKLETTRFTFTFPTINNASNVIFLVGGEEKAETLSKVLHGEFQPEEFPSQNIRPANGNLFWLVDEKAAQFLK